MIFVFARYYADKSSDTRAAVNLLLDQGADGFYYRWQQTAVNSALKPLEQPDNGIKKSPIQLLAGRAKPLTTLLPTHNNLQQNSQEIWLGEMLKALAPDEDSYGYFVVNADLATAVARLIYQYATSLSLDMNRLVLALPDDIEKAVKIKSQYPELVVAVEFSKEPDSARQKALFMSKIDIVTLPAAEIHESFVSHLHRRAIQIFALTDSKLSKEKLYDKLMVLLKLRIDGVITDQVEWASSVINGQAELHRSWHDQSKHPNPEPEAKKIGPRKSWTDGL